MSAPWWHSAVIYQIYPRSFQDTDGDGIGDLRGVEQRLDYLVWLGVDALWICPMYPSPMADFGYDVADYCDIDPQFGTLADFDSLLAHAHRLGLRVILDFVPNHTSCEHPWFKESRASRESPKRDWYLWRDAAENGGPPNNWISDFGGSAWQWDEATKQYYYHAFLKEQPDLNWRNPEVAGAMFDVVRFWLARGVDGFRIDVLWHMVKDAAFRENPVNLEYRAARGVGEMHRVHQTYSTDQPEVHAIAASMRRIADGFGDRLLIGEIYLPLDRLMTYYGREGDGVHMPFNFLLIDAPWNAQKLATTIAEYDAALPLGGWPNWVLGNHDRPRIADRLGEPQARVAAMLLFTLRGTATLYYGDELGIGRVVIPRERVRDPRELGEPGRGLGRDPVRTPMAWDGTPSGGFTRGAPWLPLHGDWATRNVAQLETHAESMLTLHRALLALRRKTPALAVGAITVLEASGDVLAYERRLGEDARLVLLNLGSTPQEYDLPAWAHGGRVALSTRALSGDDERVGAHVTLGPDEGLIVAPLTR